MEILKKHPHDEWLELQAQGPAPAIREESIGKPVMPPDLYTGATGKYPYGTDLSKMEYTDESYKLAGGYLSGKGLVEDWGCGTTWARQYIHAPYRGVDGAWSPWASVVTDLREYRSEVPKILLRHVLEHNWDWRKVLNNALDSYTDRMMVILFLRPGEKDKNIYRNTHGPHSHIPAISMCESDLNILLDSKSSRWYSEEIETRIESRFERIYWIEK